MRGRLLFNFPNWRMTRSTSGSRLPARVTTGLPRSPFPSADDLRKLATTPPTSSRGCKEGGDHGQTMWLATCGLEYPDVVVSVSRGDPRGWRQRDPRRFTARPPPIPTPPPRRWRRQRTPNMELHVVGQPDAKKLNKDDEVRFTGTLTAYTQSPFMLTWDNAKINADDLKDLPSAPAGAPGTPKKPAGQASSGKEALRRLPSRENQRPRKNLRGRGVFGDVVRAARRVRRVSVLEAPVRPVVELVEADLAAQRIAVNAQQARGARLVAVGAVQHALDELLLKFIHALRRTEFLAPPSGPPTLRVGLSRWHAPQKCSAASFRSGRSQLIRGPSTGGTLPGISRRVPATTSAGSSGPGGCLFQPMRSR